MQEEQVRIGYVIRTHGVKGHLRIAFEDNCKELSESEALYFLVKGVYLPFFIREISWFENGDALVLLEEFNNREEADQYARRPIFGPPEYVEFDESDEPPLIGYRIQDEAAGDMGSVTAVADMGAYLLLTVDKGGREVLIPLHPNLIIREDPEQQVLYTRLPEGLTEL